MASYILSNANRFYTGLESSYGQTPAITATNRFPAVKLTAKNQLETADRRDKTGSRTFVGIPAGLRRNTTFDLTTYMTSWGGQSSGPSYGPLFQASMGAAPAMYGGGSAAAGSSGTSGCIMQRRDPICYGYCEHDGRAGERPILQRPGCWNRDRSVHFLFPGDGFTKCQHFRLLGSEYRAAADSVRGGGKPDDG
jgi:hypothetical protein